MLLVCIFLLWYKNFFFPLMLHLYPVDLKHNCGEAIFSWNEGKHEELYQDSRYITQYIIVMILILLHKKEYYFCLFVYLFSKENLICNQSSNIYWNLVVVLLSWAVKLHHNCSPSKQKEEKIQWKWLKEITRQLS